MFYLFLFFFFFLFVACWSDAGYIKIYLDGNHIASSSFDFFNLFNVWLLLSGLCYFLFVISQFLFLFICCSLIWCWKYISKVIIWPAALLIFCRRLNFPLRGYLRARPGYKIEEKSVVNWFYYLCKGTIQLWIRFSLYQQWQNYGGKLFSFLSRPLFFVHMNQIQ